jgi:uncharacterized membrane protein YidH (DUF202 family)
LSSGYIFITQVGLTITLYNLGMKMNNKIIGIVLIIVGVALALWGYNIYDSATSQVTRVVSGDTPIEAWGGMVGGVIAALIGITKLK